MITSDSITNISKALLKVQQRIEPVVKDGANPHFKSRYATNNSIQEYVKPILNEEGLVLLQGGVSTQGGEGLVTITTALIHAASGEFIEVAVDVPLPGGYDREGRAVGPNAQHAGSAISYGRRYLLSSILALSTEDDDDGETAAGRPRQMQSVAAQTGHRAPPAPAFARLADVAASCPKCGSDMWDNRIGKKNPKAPDFKCKGRQCDGVIWPPKDGEKAKPATQHVGPGLVDRQPDATDNQDDDLPF